MKKYYDTFGPFSVSPMDSIATGRDGLNSDGPKLQTTVSVIETLEPVH